MLSFRRRLPCSTGIWRWRFFQWNHQSIGRPFYRLLPFNIIASSPYDLFKGDIRSRLIRLIPPAPANSTQDAIRAFLAYRLPSNSSQQEARDQWRDIVEGNSSLWKGIPTDRKETIRGSSYTFIHLSSSHFGYSKAFSFTLKTNSWNAPIKTSIFATEGRCIYLRSFLLIFIPRASYQRWELLLGSSSRIF